MRLYETTSTVSGRDAAPILRYVNKANLTRLVRGTVLIFIVLAAVLGILVYREDPQEAWFCVIFMLGLALMFGAFGFLVIRFGGGHYASSGDITWTHTTWFDGKCFHRKDDDGDEFSWPLRKIRWAWRNGWMLYLCTSSRALIPVNMLYLSETDRESLLQLLQTKCPGLVAFE